MRMSTIGTMMPRRLITPLMNSGAFAMRVTVVVAADLLHLQDVDAVFLGAEREDEEFAAAAVTGVRSRRCVVALSGHDRIPAT